MSNTQAPAFPQDAYNSLVVNVHRPFFLEKLARDWGVVPNGPDEELQLLNLAGTLRQAKEAEQIKQANAGGNSFLTEATDSLKGAMRQLGYGDAPTSHELQVKHAAAQLAANPYVQQAVMDYGSYLGQIQAAAQ